MKNVTTGFPDPSQPDDQNTHDQSPFRAPRPGDRTWNKPRPQPSPPQWDQWVHGNSPPPEIKALWGPSTEVPVPRGNYPSVIKRTYHDRSKNGCPFFAIVFEIALGKYQGRCMEYKLWLTPKGIDRARVCCAKFGVFTIEDLYEVGLVGQTCTIFIDAKDNVPETEIKAFDPIDLPAFDPEGGEGSEPCGAD